MDSSVWYEDKISLYLSMYQRSNVKLEYCHILFQVWDFWVTEEQIKDTLHKKIRVILMNKGTC